MCEMTDFPKCYICGRIIPEKLDPHKMWVCFDPKCRTQDVYNLLKDTG